MKTPEEIKKGLEQCAETDTCENCHYRDDCMEVFRNTPVTKDALAYIQQLEERNSKLENALRNLANSSSNARDAANKVIEHLKSRLARYWQFGKEEF